MRVTARDDIAKSDDPVWITQTAFDAVKDKKSILRAAKFASRPPTGQDSDAWRWIIIPLIEPDELFDRWTGDSTEETEGPDGRMANNIRAGLLPMAIAFLLMGLIADGLIWSSVSHRSLAAVGVALVALVVGWLIMKRWYRWILRYQRARYSADKGLAFIMKRMKRAKKNYPDRLADEVSYFRLKCLEVIDREAAVP